MMDDDRQGQENIPIQCALTVTADRLAIDFSGTANQVQGNINCPLSVTAAAVYDVFRCLMPDYPSACAGALRLLDINAPEAYRLNAQSAAAVAAGNVETSTRIVDVVMGAWQKALPFCLPAASHGSMNTIAIGVAGQWNYYETVGGSMDASAAGNDLDAVQTHMTT